MREPRLPKKIQEAIFVSFVDDKTAVQTTIDIGRRYYKQTSEGWKVGKDGAYMPCWHESFYKNVLRYFRHYREVIMLNTQREYPKMNGEVEADLTFFGGHEMSEKREDVEKQRLLGDKSGKPVRRTNRKSKKKPYRRPVLGILERGGRVILLPMPSRARPFIELMISKVVEKGTFVYTDHEGGMNELHLLGYKHCRINKSKGHVSPEGWHTNNIESFFREMNGYRRKQFKGIPKHTVDMHIKEREFRYNNRGKVEETLRSLLK